MPQTIKSHLQNGVGDISDVLWVWKGNNPSMISKETHKFWHAQYFES